MEKLVSVIIPTFHGYEFISRTIKTVLCQSYPNIEIIVVDDNGLNTEEQINTEKVVKTFGNKVKYIAHSKNKNGAAARNTGIKNSNGDYICFLDDDDLILPDRISACVKKLEEHENYDAVFVDVLCADEHLIPTKIVYVRKEGNCYKDVMLDNMFFGTGSNIFLTRKSIEKTGYFDEAFIRHQDLEYMIRFYRHHQSAYIPEILVVKSKNGTNNIPNYEKLKKTKELYIVKFQSEIEAMDENEKQLFYETQEKQLRFSENLCTMGKRRNLREKKEYFIYGYLPGTSIFPVLNQIRKKFNSRKICKELDQAICQFLDIYR